MQYSVNFGRIETRARTAPGPVFRIAVLGDFSGRGAGGGVAETGEALARRKPRLVDVDTLDSLVARLSPKLTLTFGDTEALVVPLSGLDDFHPDQLAENLPVFEALLDLRRNLQSRTGFDRAAKEVLGWAGEDALPPAPSRRARGTAVATDRKLSDFARLVGRPTAMEASADDLIRRLVGPYVVPERDGRQDALLARVDAALSDAMRRVLHHPDFQAAEALWRGVEFLVRQVETGARLHIVLYDISAEELAADLSVADALDRSALHALLVEQPALDAHQGPLSLIAGLYQFEVTPPHADLLGRLAQVAAVAGAPFVAGVGFGGLQAPPHEWHPLTRQAWDALRALPAAAYLGLAAPRCLLRLPYGKRTDPIDAFAFDEFSRQSGLQGMLWGNPALLPTCLIAESWLRGGKSMALGSLATVGDLPVFVYQDTDGEQIALPCTERLLTERQAVQVSGCGVMPLVSLRGRGEVRVASFCALLADTPLAGRWAPVDAKPPPPIAPAPAKSSPAPKAPAPTPPAPPAAPPEAVSTGELDALLADLDAPQSAAAPAPAAAEARPPTPAVPAAGPPVPASRAAEADDLDALLADLNAAPPAAAPDAVDADLDALLASLK